MPSNKVEQFMESPLVAWVSLICMFGMFGIGGGGGMEEVSQAPGESLGLKPIDSNVNRISY